MTLGYRIKLLRENKGIGQQELCNFLGIEQSTLANYENDRRTPKPEMLSKIADFFNTSTDYLLGRTDIKNLEIKNLDKLANKEIYSVEDALEIIESQEGLMLKGETLTDEDKILLANALQLGMKYVLDKKQKEKENK